MTRQTTTHTTHTLHAWRAEPDAPLWVSARGEHVRTADDRTLLDLSMEHGACLFGHATTLDRIIHRYPVEELATGLGSTHSTILRERATDELCAWAREEWRNRPELVAGILHTGAEAVEAAIKTALAATGKRGIVAFDGAYHGSFGAAAAVTSSDSARATFADTIRFEHVRHERYGAVPLLDDDTACLIVEPIQGATGTQVPPDGWLDRLREECTRVGAMLILDDVLVGSGRTGRRIEGGGCGPDIVTLAKAIGGGITCSVVLARREVAEAAWEGEEAPSLSTTFYGHPLSSAAILETLALHELHDVERLAQRIADAVQAAARETALVARGCGAIWALDTGRDGGGDALASALLDRGVIVTATGANSEAVQLLPSLLMDEESLRWMREAIIAAADSIS